VGFRSDLYPGRDLNPHNRNGHRILSPDNFPENSVESDLSLLHFDAKRDISAPYFRTSPTLPFFNKIVLQAEWLYFIFPIDHQSVTLKTNQYGNNKQ